MYKTYSANDWRKHLKLDDNYQLQAFLSFGTYQKSLYQMLKASFTRQNIEAQFYNFDDDFMAPILEIKVNNKYYWFAIVYGGALLSEYLHIASLLGSKKNIFMGTCSGLQQGVSSLDFIVPTSCHTKDSSANGYAQSESNVFYPNSELSNYLSEIIAKKQTMHRGPMLSYQAMLSETKQDIKTWAEEGYQAVDMETATVFAVSAHFGVPSASILRIGDNLVGPDLANHEGLSKAKELRHKVSEQVLDIVTQELIK